MNSQRCRPDIPRDELYTPVSTNFIIIYHGACLHVQITSMYLDWSLKLFSGISNKFNADVNPLLSAPLTTASRISVIQTPPHTHTHIHTHSLMHCNKLSLFSYPSTLTSTILITVWHLDTCTAIIMYSDSDNTTHIVKAKSSDTSVYIVE